MQRTIAFKTLGCRLNQYETEALASQFVKNNYKVVDFETNADVFVINSCTVTNQSDQKTRTTVNQATRHKNQPVVVVMGCMSPEQRASFSTGQVTYLVDNEQKSSIFQLVDAHFKGELASPEILPSNRFNYELTQPLFHTRSFVKIQDGCDNFCSFCIIPMVRGRAISRPAKDILNNIKELIESGYKEVVLTGVNISRYFHDGITFEDLLEKILELPLDFRLRISSMEPDELTGKFIRLLQHPKLCPHLHLCLQSGSDKILLKMKRMYTVSSFMQLVDQIRSERPDFNLTTDIMVGFPGETNQDFEDTCQIAREAMFSHIHTFKYSRRTGTRADRFPEQVSEFIKSIRSQRVRAVSEENRKLFLQQFVGLKQQVLVEKITNNMAMGYGEHYVPVKFPTFDRMKENNLISVKIEKLEQTDEVLLVGNTEYTMN